MTTKYIFVTGGVVSGIGKGIIASSIGRLLKNRGLSVFMQKFDPYINVDPGTMSPYQHGEVFVTKDGAETDLDLGHYERFIDVELTQNANITTGRVYQTVINNERNGLYDGATVQVIPHITDEIKQKIYDAAKESEADVVITEIGGTVGDIESLPFLEAVRQVHGENKSEDVIFIHTTLIPKVPASNEYKTKPTQHSFKELMALGIKANIIVTRCDEPLEESMKDKIALFCDVNKQAIIESRNVDNLYEMPLRFQEQGLDAYILRKFKLDHLGPADMSEWEDMLDHYKNLKYKINVALVGKYVELQDAYLSVVEALYHAGAQAYIDVKIDWINSGDLNPDNYQSQLAAYDGIVVPSGFGKRGSDGMILTAKFARENNIPFLGIGLGMQMAIVEFARNVCNINQAHSIEMNPNAELIFTSNNGLIGEEAPMRLGNYPMVLNPGSLAYDLYETDYVLERHRHRYEFNNQYRDVLRKKGLVFSGLSPDGQLVELVEYSANDFFVGCSYHAEFKSRPDRSHPLFKGFVEKSLQVREKRVK